MELLRQRLGMRPTDVRRVMRKAPEVLAPRADGSTAADAVEASAPIEKNIFFTTMFLKNRNVSEGIVGLDKPPYLGFVRGGLAKGDGSRFCPSRCTKCPLICIELSVTHIICVYAAKVDFRYFCQEQ